mmetsp:Transcript_133925/g.299369  ORF Transcript_133925/g.299369 Transcript_133925/m.299369 type:complete len:142 (+) Transcript_133925:1216-1641(+)
MYVRCCPMRRPKRCKSARLGLSMVVSRLLESTVSSNEAALAGRADMPPRRYCGARDQLSSGLPTKSGVPSEAFSTNVGDLPPPLKRDAKAEVGSVALLENRAGGDEPTPFGGSSAANVGGLRSPLMCGVKAEGGNDTLFEK